MLESIRRKIQFHSNFASSLYNISSPTIQTIFISPVLIIILYLAIFLPAATRPFALLIVEENYPIELITFFGYFFASILGLSLAWQGWKRREGFLVVGIYAFFALGLLLIGMEEISWGQSFFRFATPDAIHKLNEQQEMNIHNLQGFQGNSEFFFVAFGLGGFLGMWLFSKKAFQKTGVPVILILWFLIITVIGGIDLINDFVPLHSKFDTLVITLSEVIEMLIALAGFLYLWLNSRMLSYGKVRQALAREITFDGSNINIILKDTRSINVPLDWFPQLREASPEERKRWQLVKDGLRVQWPEIDVDVCVEQFIAGIPSIEAQIIEHSPERNNDG